MELYQGIINGIEVSFGINISVNSYESKPIPKNEYYLMALDPGKGTITMEQFNKRLFHLKNDVLGTIVNAQKENKNPISVISDMDEVKNWLQSIDQILLKGNGPGEIMIEINHRSLKD
jgi:hypothetical protein